ncbi:MFS transporter [Geomicrobium sediminis]|uniref:MFS family permease n=1 Tax=Geomicrobium sediminis TaxID=1347788 RepID=A0ABS2PFT5_9BACL|nr:MFS transporter [Geomicrobium sediminis]MBM7634127.1 MFS family permease [Geomicrobium sediminis]
MTITRLDHILFLASVFCFWLATYIYVPIFSLYLEQISFPYAAIGIILGSYGVLQVALRFPLGMLSDRLRSIRKGLYVSGFVIAAISGLILVFFDSFVMVLIGRLLSGVTAAMWVMATILYAQYVHQDQAGKAMGAMQLFTVLPQFASMLTAGLLVESFGWLSPFWVGVIVSIIGLVLSLFVKVVDHDATQVQTLQAHEYFTRTLKTKSLMPLATIALITHGVMFISIFGFTPNYAATLGINEQQMVLLMTAFFLPHALSSLMVATIQLTKKVELIIVMSSLFLSAIAFLTVPLSTGLLSISIIHAIIGLALGFVLPICLSQAATLAPPSMKTTIMGFYQSYYAAGIFLGPWLAGLIAEHYSLPAVFVFASFTAVVGGILTIYLIVQSKQNT